MKISTPRVFTGCIQSTGPALASAGPDWKHFCGTPLRGVCI